MAGEEHRARSQNIILEDRKKLHVSGVEDVSSFDDGTVVMQTALGELTVRGEGLRVAGLCVETGDLSVEGTVAELCYAHARQRTGLRERLFG